MHGCSPALPRGHSREGDSAGAKREFLESSQKKPASFRQGWALAQQSQAEGDYQSALRYTNEILAIDSDLPVIRLLSAVSLNEHGQ